jgi:SAM-dependent methyltransferase
MDTAVISPSSRLATYDDIALEYYDPVRHPTCANFRELSTSYLSPRLTRLSGNEELIVEVGAGKSIVAPVLAALGLQLRMLILLDKSAEMLTHSAEWQHRGARLNVTCASETGLPAGSADVVVASLGDPYNTGSFWREIARVLRPGGVCHFTTPAYEWASRYRSPEMSAAAEFVRSDGTVLFMPSRVFTYQDQAELFAEAGLRVVDVAAFTVADLSSEPAPKLLCVSTNIPVLRGYSLQR